ncbi:MAG: hypothetical protein CVV05_07215 [Gammaproteobacteria bacterium HGW-Gammaproteobacteria-1]|jgi:hypothetical protein|nr:MAG: hypothetical protein CVV05_07215 [Gammaproteobacteria bacterium HGW-Gammaproteobacteria-1]
MPNIFKLDISLIISFAAILVMIFCLIQVYSLKAKIPGGVIGKRWNFLVMLVVLFSVGYLATPFFGTLPAELMRLIAALIFFFGAIYVLITVKLIYQIIQELTE